MYFVNHSKKEWLFIGNGDGNNVIFAFNLFNWSTKDDIRMYQSLDSHLVKYSNPQLQVDSNQIKEILN